MLLPMLEAMAPRTALASGVAPTAPVRMAFVFFPNGAIQPNWKPEGEESDWKLSRTLEPLADHKEHLTVFSGLTQHHGRANGDGAGDHARCASSFLTGAQPVKTAGANIKVGVSVDQAAAALIGRQTAFPSLELGIERGRNSGNCDSGYSCAYSANVSWKTESTPMAKEINPKLAFERLFGAKDGATGRAERDIYRQSILDLVAEDAAVLRRRLGKSDQRKLDEYFSSVRELEHRLDMDATRLSEVPEYDVPAGIPKELESHIQLMYDVMTLAFQTDSTRIGTFMLANAGSNRSYPQVDVKGGHHSLSHHRNEESKVEDLTKIDIFLASQFGYFLKKLKSVQEGERTLLDNSLILYGSGLSDANRHTHHDLPIVLAGSGGGRLQTDRLLHQDENTPLNNLFVSMCHMAGANVETLGDSTGALSL
ncbi:MAG: DUF1552 domain-containing protein [Fuerstiella sp.]|nr:DUF1552 domain-containing protein [Fuerstiella sp.]MCP4853234.1 DUF1552 domain-containing protein [Fuerstiella sp.]